MKMLSMCLIVCQIFSATLGQTCESEYCKFFDFQLLEAACDKDNFKNVAVAPLSVKVALMSLIEGTDGKARQELVSILNLPSNVPRIREAAGVAMHPFQASESGIQSEVGTCLWFGEKIEASANYTDSLQSYYNSDYEMLNFTDLEGSVGIINEWALRSTNNNTQPIVVLDDLSENFLLMLTSVLYFKGNWHYGFFEDTHWHGCYMIPERGCQAISVMHNRFTQNYALVESLDAHVVELPLVDEKLSMLLFCPNMTGFDSLNYLITKLSRTRISEILGSLKETELDLVIPTFLIEDKNDLVPVLKNMGIRNLFEKKANLSGLMQDSLAGVDKFLHRVKVETDTVGEIESNDYYSYFLDDEEDRFTYMEVDRPFVFAIIDRASNGVLFAGRVVHPEYDVPNPVDYEDFYPYLDPYYRLPDLGDY